MKLCSPVTLRHASLTLVAGGWLGCLWSFSEVHVSQMTTNAVEDCGRWLILVLLSALFISGGSFYGLKSVLVASMQDPSQQGKGKGLLSPLLEKTSDRQSSLCVFILQLFLVALLSAVIYVGGSVAGVITGYLVKRAPETNIWGLYALFISTVFQVYLNTDAAVIFPSLLRLSNNMVFVDSEKDVVPGENCTICQKSITPCCVRLEGLEASEGCNTAAHFDCFWEHSSATATSPMADYGMASIRESLSAQLFFCIVSLRLKSCAAATFLWNRWSSTRVSAPLFVC